MRQLVVAFCCSGVVQIANGFIIVAPNIIVKRAPLAESHKSTVSKTAVDALNAQRSHRDPHLPIPSIVRNNDIVEFGRNRDWMAILNLFQKEGTEFNYVNFATAISNMAKIRGLDTKHPLFLDFLKAMEANMDGPDKNPRCYANTVHALAKLDLVGHDDIIVRILDELADSKVAKGFVLNGKPQEIANTAWACATLGHLSPCLFAAIDARSEWLIRSGNPQEIANTAWACATLGHSSPRLFAAIDSRSEWLVRNGNPQDIANTAWAGATLGHSSPCLFAAIDARSEWLVRNGNPQNIANTAWAGAKLGHCAPLLFQEIDKQSDWLSTHATKRDVAGIVSSFKALRHSPPLFDCQNN